MMRPLSYAIVFAACVLQLSACDHGTQDETAAAMARDSSLAYDLQLAAADTAPFSGAADVAVAERSGSIPPMVDAIPTSSSPTARVVSNKSNATVSDSPGELGASRTGTTTESATTTRSATVPSSVTPSSGASKLPARPSAEDFAGPSCASPALADQRRCLLSYLAHSDVMLDRNYQALITALKREAGGSSRGTEPATVLRLRTSQRNWLVYRDNECRQRNEGKEGPLWAPTRAQCLAGYSGQRAEELANALSARSTTSAVSAKATPVKRTKQVATKQTKRKRG